MIKSLEEARILDGLPRILAKQPWVMALSEAMGILHEMTLRFAGECRIYTGIDSAAENVLDALAVNWKIDWYDTGYSITQKREMIKSALTVRRTMGTAAAVKKQIEVMFPGSKVEEWFEYGGTPGNFRITANVTTAAEKEYFAAMTVEEIEKRIATAKRYSSKLEEMRFYDEAAGAAAYAAAVFTGCAIVDSATAVKY